MKHNDTIVVVEDNADSREVLRLLLEIEGYVVHGAGDGSAGVDAIVNLQPDVALVDVGLPDLDGYEVARRARREAPGTRLIALTGYGQPDDLSRSAAAGFDAHVVKPVDPTRLLRLIAESSRRSS